MKSLLDFMYKVIILVTLSLLLLRCNLTTVVNAPNLDDKKKLFSASVRLIKNIVYVLLFDIPKM